ncbi:MAG: hypothetical protein WKF75_08670 [Singulisphaera sp.]
MLRDVGHGLGGPGQLAGTLRAVALGVLAGGIVEVAGGVEVEPRLGARLPVAALSNPVVGVAEFTDGPLGVVLWAAARRGRQLGVGAVDPRGVAGVADGAGQGVRGRGVLVGLVRRAARLFGLDRLAIDARGALGPVLEPLLGLAGGAVVGAEPAEPIIRLARSASGPWGPGPPFFSLWGGGGGPSVGGGGAALSGQLAHAEQARGPHGD